MLDYSRILSRLRSKHAARSRKTVGKQGLITLLKKTVDQRSQGAQEIQLRVAKLADLFESFERLSTKDVSSSAGHMIIVNIVEKAHALTLHGGLKSVLKSSACPDPSLLRSLSDSVRKVGRYYRVSVDLINAARNPRYTIFNHITIETLMPPATDQGQIMSSSSSFDEILQRICPTSFEAESLSAARQKFHARMSSHDTRWKVHAEIQLLFFYELNPKTHPPRMLCSSKSACYLCSLFVRTHGRFHVPRTHGRLYDRWFLPEWSKVGVSHDHLELAISKFDTALRAKIRFVIDRQKFQAVYPNESVTLTVVPWSSCATLSNTIVQPCAIEESSRSLENVLQLRNASFVTRDVLPSSSSSNETPKPVSLQSLSSTKTIPTCQHLGTSALATKGDAALHTLYLIKDSWNCHELSEPTFTINIRIKSVHLQISYDCAQREDEVSLPESEVCWVGVKWLDFHGVNHLFAEASWLHDLDSLESESILLENGAARNPEGLWMRKNNDVLVIKFAFGHPPTDAV